MTTTRIRAPKSSGIGTENGEESRFGDDVGAGVGFIVGEKEGVGDRGWVIVGVGLEV